MDTQASGTLRRTDNRIDYTLCVTPAAPASVAEARRFGRP